MTALLLGVKTTTRWVNDIATTPIIGGIFLFVFMFVPPVVTSFLLQATIPALSDEIGFTKAMLVLLPGWNLFLWLIGVRLYFFYLPSWILFGGIAIVKAILLVSGKTN